MARLRVSLPARADLEHILTTSLERWGDAARGRYAALLASALRALSREPEGRATRERSDVLTGMRSLTLRHIRGSRKVKEPVHVIFYRLERGVVEIVRVLHERMDPSRHVGDTKTSRRTRRR